MSTEPARSRKDINDLLLKSLSADSFADIQRVLSLSQKEQTLEQTKDAQPVTPQKWLDEQPKLQALQSMLESLPTQPASPQTWKDELPKQEPASPRKWKDAPSNDEEEQELPKAASNDEDMVKDEWLAQPVEQAVTDKTAWRCPLCGNEIDEDEEHHTQRQVWHINCHERWQKSDKSMRLQKVPGNNTKKTVGCPGCQKNTATDRYAIQSGGDRWWCASCFNRRADWGYGCFQAGTKKKMMKNHVAPRLF